MRGIAATPEEAAHLSGRRAKARGVRFGRPPKLTVHQRQEAFQRLANGETQADIARSYAVHPATIGRTLGTVGSPFDGASVAAALQASPPDGER